MSEEYEDEQEQEPQEQPSQELIPVEQETILFDNKPLVAVKLPDGQSGVVLRWICDNLGLAPNSQITRIKRTEAIADDLIYVRVETDGGPQRMPTLILHAVPYWLATIDTRRMRDDAQRREILQYQRKVVDVLYAWAARPRPTHLVPSEPIVQPVAPEPGATREMWMRYHQQMFAFLEWQVEVEHWQDSMETRMEGIESIIPDILERLPPLTIAPAHQLQVRSLVKQLSDLTGKHQATIYSDLYTAFAVPRYQDLPETEWENVEQWFNLQIDRARQRKRGKP